MKRFVTVVLLALGLLIVFASLASAAETQITVVVKATDVPVAAAISHSSAPVTFQGEAPSLVLAGTNGASHNLPASVPWTLATFATFVAIAAMTGRPFKANHPIPA